MTGMPAARLGLQTKGLIRAGMDADLLVFDPDAVRDEATYEEPTRCASGIDLVYVRGRKIMDGGRYTGAAEGKLLRRR
jgi:N-acyl-D-amino-acid deacylase